MCSFVLFSFYCMIIFALKIKAQNTFYYNYLRSCYPPYNYYNTITYKCLPCNNSVYNNICYSTNPISIYGFGSFNKTLPNQCDSSKGEYFTELDEDGKYSGELNCRSTKINETYPRPRNEEATRSFSFYYLDNIRSRQMRLILNSFNLKDFDENEINYAYYACLNGTYEKSCQYLLNLCVLSMYDYQNNIYCKFVQDFKGKFDSFR